MFRSIPIVLALALAAASCASAGEVASDEPPPAGQLAASVAEDHKGIVVTYTRDGQTRAIVDDPLCAAGQACPEHTETEIEVLNGSRGRVGVVWLFAETGADIFVRDIFVWVVDLTTGRILWPGSGTYSVWFDANEELEVPAVAIEKGQIVISFVRGCVMTDPNVDGCPAAPVRREVVERMPLPWPPGGAPSTGR